MPTVKELKSLQKSTNSYVKEVQDRLGLTDYEMFLLANQIRDSFSSKGEKLTDSATPSNWGTDYAFGANTDHLRINGSSTLYFDKETGKLIHMA